MRVKASNRVEGIFAHAVAMDNRGLKNTIHCIGSDVFIVNFDHSMILRFSLRQNEVSFSKPVSFNANEYDSPEFTFTEDESGNKIIFHTASKEYTRKKIGRAEDFGMDAESIRKIYRQLKKEAEGNELSFFLSDECVPLLEDSLSHTEISVENSKLILRQRNVYSGTMIEVSPKGGGAGFFQVDKLPENFPPVAVKTKDFMSLFIWQKSLAFTPAEGFVMVKDVQKGDFDGVIALCRYDMIIDLHARAETEKEEGKNIGRKEQEKRSGKQKADRPISKRRK